MVITSRKEEVGVTVFLLLHSLTFFYFLWITLYFLLWGEKKKPSKLNFILQSKKGQDSFPSPPPPTAQPWGRTLSQVNMCDDFPIPVKTFFAWLWVPKSSFHTSGQASWWYLRWIQVDQKKGYSCPPLGYIDSSPLFGMALGHLGPYHLSFYHFFL